MSGKARNKEDGDFQDVATLESRAQEQSASSKKVAKELSIIVPTFNEKNNVREIVKRIAACMKDHVWEVIFVDDDSPDGTSDEARQLAQEDPRVRCIQRIGRRGLSSACVEGMLSSSAPYFAVIDGDLQHDETLLPKMLKQFKLADVDLVVGSRFVDGGSVGKWDESRHAISKLATNLSKLVVKADISDPMSGFFMVRREVLRDSVRNLSSLGFKVLLDIVASSPRPLNIKELPYEFRNREQGESKMDSNAVYSYLLMLADKLVGRWVPVRFISFASVGGFGVLVHMLTLWIFYGLASMPFIASQSIATVVAMTFNYTINNILTFRDMSLSGNQWFIGWLSFSLACSIGAISNVGIAAYLFSSESGWFLAAMAGILVASVWNYAITSVYTWKKVSSN